MWIYYIWQQLISPNPVLVWPLILLEHKPKQERIRYGWENGHNKDSWNLTCSVFQWFPHSADPMVGKSVVTKFSAWFPFLFVLLLLETTFIPVFVAGSGACVNISRIDKDKIMELMELPFPASCCEVKVDRPVLQPVWKNSWLSIMLVLHCTW